MVLLKIIRLGFYWGKKTEFFKGKRILTKTNRKGRKYLKLIDSITQKIQIKQRIRWNKRNTLTWYTAR